MYKTKVIPQHIYAAAQRADFWSISDSDHGSIIQGMYVPTVIKKSPNGDRAFDIYSALLEDNAVFLETPIDSSVATNIEASLLYLANNSGKKEINMHISSPGGSVSAGLQILDTMWYIQATKGVLVNTICTGIAMSMGAFLLAVGTGRRMAFPNSSILIHQPLISGGGIGGQATDVDIHSEHMQETKKLLTCYLALHTGQDVGTVLNDCERDNYMTAEEAKDYGIIDQVFEFGRRKELTPLMDQYEAALQELKASRKHKGKA